MKRIATLFCLLSLGASAMMASVLSDAADKIGAVENISVTDATAQLQSQMDDLKRCQVFMLDDETLPKVREIVGALPDDKIFMDITEDDAAVKIWAERFDDGRNGEMILFVNAEGHQIAIYINGNFDEIQNGIQID